MVAKEAKARIKINKLLEEAGWRFFDSDQRWVDANKALIQRSEAKSKAAIGRVWEEPS